MYYGYGYGLIDIARGEGASLSSGNKESTFLFNNAATVLGLISGTTEIVLRVSYKVARCFRV